MSKRKRAARPASLYEEYRQKTGWYFAAWRDFKGLTLEQVADATGRSRGYVSDLETGAVRPDRPPSRFNRDTLEEMAKLLGTTGGRLIDVNPFTMWDGADDFAGKVSKMPEDDRAAVVGMADRLARRFDVG